MKYTEADVEDHFKRLAKALGKKVELGAHHKFSKKGELVGGSCWKKTRQGVEGEVGCWFLTHGDARAGGGYGIAEVVNKGGAINHPISGFRSAREFCESVQFFEEAQRIKRRK